MAKGHAFQAPTGTRDFYPADMLRRRYIEKMWRDTSIRHGFEEIDGPTFEHLDLYTVKSGEGIVNELFSFKRAGGEKDYALRPEFTPTLARMYAAKAGGLAKPTKWFTAGPFFRAERPQRGRLREFLQWNVDFLGGESTPEGVGATNAEALGLLVDFFVDLGMTSQDVKIRISDRELIAQAMIAEKFPRDKLDDALRLLDAKGKLPAEEFYKRCQTIGLNYELLESGLRALSEGINEVIGSNDWDRYEMRYQESGGKVTLDLAPWRALTNSLHQVGASAWCEFDASIVRGLAYYTGMVFEVHEAGGKERAIAGGGRYDNLIELFGGPPTPAVGFGMGDVVLSLVLQDKGLMPEGAALMDKLAEPPASPRPDVFVIANDQPESIAAVRPLVAGLRRGENGVRPLHARHSYKATKNIGKLLQEASACHARFAAILESSSEATLKNLTTGEQVQKVPAAEIAARVSIPR